MGSTPAPRTAPGPEPHPPMPTGASLLLLLLLSAAAGAAGRTCSRPVAGITLLALVASGALVATVGRRVHDAAPAAEVAEAVAPCLGPRPCLGSTVRLASGYVVPMLGGGQRGFVRVDDGSNYPFNVTNSKGESGWFNEAQLVLVL